MGALKRFDAGLARVESALLVVALLGILGLGVAQIVLRFFAISFDWADEVMRNLTLWLGFLGASVATMEGKHINVDALTRFLAPRMRAAAALLVGLAAAGISAVLCWSALKVVLSSIERLGTDAGVVSAAGIPVAVWQSLLPVAMAIIALRFLFKAAQAALLLAGRGTLESSELTISANASESPKPAKDRDEVAR